MDSCLTALDLKATHQPFSRSLLGKSRSLFLLAQHAQRRKRSLTLLYPLRVIGMGPFTSCS